MGGARCSVLDKLTICRMCKNVTKKGKELSGAWSGTPANQKVTAMNDKDAASLLSCLVFLLLLLPVLVMMVMTVQ